MVGIFYCEKSTSDLSIYNTLCQELATVTMVILLILTYLLYFLPVVVVVLATATASNSYPPQLYTSLVED